MTVVFVDTSYLIARIRRNDQWRQVALAARARLGEVFLVTTDEVLTEFLTALSAAGPHLRALAANTIYDILNGSTVKVAEQSHESFLHGLARYASRTDKSYSLQDCISMNVMEEMGITEALTSDHNFEQEGFTILMRPGR